MVRMESKPRGAEATWDRVAIEESTATVWAVKVDGEWAEIFARHGARAWVARLVADLPQAEPEAAR